MFFTVMAAFEYTQYGGKNLVQSFQKLENAEKFAEEMKNDFLSYIQKKGALDREESYEKEFGLYFYGISEDGKDFCAVKIEKTDFWDSEYED
ncbi:hypothetical protein F7731_23705 [Cytobacillus depressus]|uniref:Uncharacterized protein n=1 Tax=Cytobacillus depressus TaxID=1602942 RepID=A0A6L3UY78_9BACI|nr:hypothetical protein [Cytobacillus depressus]KAB2328960.1 hypothetical protein F7731_23705 [Cytobacillus depressus]